MTQNYFVQLRKTGIGLREVELTHEAGESIFYRAYDLQGSPATEAPRATRREAPFSPKEKSRNAKGQLVELRGFIDLPVLQT